MYFLAPHYRNNHAAIALPQSFLFSQAHLDAVKASAEKAQRAGKRRRSAGAGLVPLITRHQQKGRRAGPHVAGATTAAVAHGPIEEELDVEEDAGAADPQVEDAEDAEAEDEEAEDADAEAEDSEDRIQNSGASAISATTAGFPKTDHHRRREFKSRSFEIIERAASFYTIGSSAHHCGMEKIFDHIREGKDAFAEQAKSNVVCALRQAATDFENLAAAADDFTDDLLELNLEETLLTAVRLKQEADALQRRTVADIRADMIAASERRKPRPTKRFE